MVVPVIDLDRARPAELGAALVDCGFFVLEHHAVPMHLWADASRAAARAFALPDATKAGYRGPDDGSQRGYLELRSVLKNGLAALDRKECWHARRPGPRFTNALPAEVPELEPALLALIDAFDRLADKVLAGIDAFLGDTGLAAASHGGDSLFRVNHYPDAVSGGASPAKGEARSGDRFGAHRDFDLITFLLGATAPGLEIQMRDGTWYPLTPSATSIVVNAGDLLEVASRGRIPSTPHRVVTPDLPDGGRLSMVYFVAPRPDVRLGDDVLAGAMIDDRLRLAGYLR